MRTYFENIISVAKTIKVGSILSSMISIRGISYILMITFSIVGLFVPIFYFSYGQLLVVDLFLTTPLFFCFILTTLLFHEGLPSTEKRNRHMKYLRIAFNILFIPSLLTVYYWDNANIQQGATINTFGIIIGCGYTLSGIIAIISHLATRGKPVGYSES